MTTPDDEDLEATVLASDQSRKAEYIGRYLIEGILGEGAMGVVYKGFDPSIKRHVAIKTIHGGLLMKEDGEEFLSRFRREAQAAGRLIHPNVVTVFEFGYHEETPFLVLEYIPGRELRAVIDDGDLDLQSTRAIFGQILTGLGVAHTAGIVHRDVKPQNVFVMPNGLTKVGDFGIARIDATGLTRTGMILGTPSYMSPEQFTGAELDHRTDLYAAASVLYEMLTGTKVFTGKTVTEVMYAVLEKEPLSADSLVSSVPASIAAVATKGLAKRMEDRYQSAEEFLTAFEAACVEASVGVPKLERSRAPFSSSDALTSEALRGAPVDITDYEDLMQLMIHRRARGELAANASELLQNVALHTLSYDSLVQFLQGLGRESDPRLATFTLANELSKRDYEKSEGARLETSVRQLAHSATKIQDETDPL